MTTPDSLTPGQRLVRARWQLKHLAGLGPSLSAGSDKARDYYASLTAAAREMVTAQDAIDNGEDL